MMVLHILVDRLKLTLLSLLLIDHKDFTFKVNTHSLLYQFNKIKDLVTYKSKPMEEKRPFPIYTTIVIVALVVIGPTLVFLLGLHQPGGSTQTGSITFAQATREIIPSLDMILNIGDTTLYMPKASTNLAGYISMVPREPNLFNLAGDSGWTRPIVIKIEYRNYQGTPAPSISFFKPVQICFQTNIKQWRDYSRRPAAYQVQYFAEGLNLPHWVALPMNSDPERLLLCGETDHLSFFALAVMLEEGVPLIRIPITGATPIPTIAPTDLLPTHFIPTRTHNQDSVPAIHPSVVPTAIPPTDQQPADTPAPPADTPAPPADTPAPPADTPAPPADTSAPPADTPSG